VTWRWDSEKYRAQRPAVSLVGGNVEAFFIFSSYSDAKANLFCFSLDLFSSFAILVKQIGSSCSIGNSADPLAERFGADFSLLLY
jgi:hypothetical protein